MEKIKIIQLRAMAPDKAMLWVDPKSNYELIKFDQTNLVDFNLELMKLYDEAGYWILPADEGDILIANEFEYHRIFPSIILPRTTNGKVLDYGKFIPKDSMIYESLETFTGMRYPKFKVISHEDIEDYMQEILFDKPDYRCVYKTTTGSGSRGVLLVQPELVKYGGKYIPRLTSEVVKNFVDYAKSGKRDVMIQDHIPFEGRLKKVNVDFVIRNGNLIGYKWDITNQSQLFTNWDNFHFMRNEYTDDLMQRVAKYLVHMGITDALMNFEAFSNHVDETWMVEFNWRYSNSMFEAQALGIDLIQKYLDAEPFETPMGMHRASRYWQCKLYDEIPYNLPSDLNDIK